jgi:CheY-like chemotaxis protein
MNDGTSAPKMILLVEDDLSLRQIYRDAFRSMYSYEVVEAEDGQDALDKLTERKPDLVLLDLVLPKIDGFAVLSRIKSDPQYQQIPVVVYSVTDQKAAIEKAMKLGANDFIIKGITPAFEVVNRVKVLLGE